MEVFNEREAGQNSSHEKVKGEGCLSWEECIRDQRMKKVLSVAQSIASRKSTVMIYGESGVGKELLSKYIHRHSQRSREKFVAINCAALPGSLLESELFGHEKGAFTDAKSTKIGLFEQAHKGTFLLDEISELPLLLQGKLLRVLQESEIQRIGGLEPKKVDVRIIGTSNQPLEKLVVEKKFRKDLYFRLNVIPLNIPSLRERTHDIIPVSHYLLNQICQENGLEKIVFHPSAVKALMSYPWPGNIRELGNILERSALLLEGSELTSSDLLFTSEGSLIKGFDDESGLESLDLTRALSDQATSATTGVVGADSGYINGSNRNSNPTSTKGPAHAPRSNINGARFSPNGGKEFPKVGMTVHEAEKLLILKTLEQTENNRTRAAEKLGISIRTLRNKLKEYRSTLKEAP